MADEWVLFSLAGNEMGVSGIAVSEMVRLTDVSQAPNMPEYMRGVINLRGTIVPVIDMRLRLGLPSLQGENKELITLLAAREQDHVRWLKELHTSVVEEREFTLATDPHKCAFGKWYDNFHTENTVLRLQLAKFDKPHRAIHRVAIEVGKIMAQEGQQAALDRVASADKNELAKMVALFAETVELIDCEANETVIVAAVGERKIGLIVDEILSVTSIDPAVIQPLEESLSFAGEKYLHGIEVSEGSTRLLLDLEMIVGNGISNHSG